MGQAVARAAFEAPEVVLRALPRGVSIDSLGDLDVIVDFSSPAGFEFAAALVQATGKPFVSGTTGLTDTHHALLERLSQKHAVLHANNMSLGVAVLARLTAQAARSLPSSFDAEIVEIHHRAKRDAPSGTARTLLSAVRDGRGEQLRAVHGRDGLIGERSNDEVGVFGVRGGDVVGEHTVFFLGDGERLELTHRATDRTIFGRGALAAARWLAGRDAGLYSLFDVVGL
jgi:4-hydroxy-tetrahydrodipicolinate reductase